MQHSISYPTSEPATPNEPAITVSRLRTVTGSRFPRKCACGCGHAIPRDPEVRYVVDFGASGAGVGSGGIEDGAGRPGS